MNILITLCGRAGSKGFRNKNLKTFLGFPLVYYSIAVINEFIKRNKNTYNISVVLNTDSKELKKIVVGQNTLQIDVINREKILGGDSVPKVSVIKDCLEKMQERKNIMFDIVVDLDITSPLRTVQDIENAVNKKISRSDTDVVYSVTDARRNPYFNMVKEESGYFYKAIPSNFTARQQAPVFYDMNASIYVYSVTALNNKPHNSFFNDNCDAIIMKDTGVLDIDSEEDFQLMQVIAKYLFGKDPAFEELYKATSAIY